MNQEPSYTPDMAALIDKPEEIIADDLGLSIEQARKVAQYISNEAGAAGLSEDAIRFVMDERISEVRAQFAELLGQIVALLLSSKNQPAMIPALAMAFGLDQLNGLKSQTQLANELGCTRALISHYVVGWRDLLAQHGVHIDCHKYRKANRSREVYRDKAKNGVIQAKMRAKKTIK